MGKRKAAADGPSTKRIARKAMAMYLIRPSAPKTYIDRIMKICGEISLYDPNNIEVGSGDYRVTCLNPAKPYEHLDEGYTKTVALPRFSIVQKSQIVGMEHTHGDVFALLTREPTEKIGPMGMRSRGGARVFDKVFLHDLVSSLYIGGFMIGIPGNIICMLDGRAWITKKIISIEEPIRLDYTWILRKSVLPVTHQFVRIGPVPGPCERFSHKIEWNSGREIIVIE